MPEGAHVLTHAVAEDALAVLRARQTPPALFRASVRRLTLLLAQEATRDLPLSSVAVETPLGPAGARVLSSRVGLVPILRAGLSMVDPLLDLLPEAEVWHLGFYRDERTLRPVPYYRKLPVGRPVDTALVLDPMLATGGSACAALRDLREWGVADLRYLGLLGAPEGLARIRAEHPDVPVFLGALDERLNENGYIFPGLGDAGDRSFHTTTS